MRLRWGLSAGRAGCLVLCGAVALAPSVRADTSRSLRVLAAASLTEVVGALAARFEGARVVPGFGGSSALARQIRDGAPGDVFLSASPDWMDFLAESGRLDGEPVVIAHNRLVCITAGGSPLAGSGAEGPRALLRRLAPGARVAIADEGVPAGEYARSALRQLSLLDAFRPRLVGQKDVRAVLHAVERGELAAGFAYATDAQAADVFVLFAFDPATHPRITYEAAVLHDAADPARARAFLAFLRSEAARELLAAAGFALP